MFQYRRSAGASHGRGAKHRSRFTTGRSYLRGIPVVLVLVAGQLALAAPAHAAPGGLDTTFSGDGKQTTDFFTNYDEINAVAVQSDGKIVVAGRAFNAAGTLSDFALARYNSNGTLDTAFDGDGKLTTSITAGNDQALALAIQSDGMIVAAGRANTGSSADIAVARYDSSGALDGGFGGGGIVTTDFNGVADQARSIVIQSDGKIVVAGLAGPSGVDGDFGVVRYNTDGSLDTSFDSDGKVSTDFTTVDHAGGVALQPADGKIVVAGQVGPAPGQGEFGVARYNTDGSLDTSFDSDGKVTTDVVASRHDVGRTVVVQADGKIVAGGQVGSNGSQGDFGLVRYDTNGGLDTGFSGDGKATTSFNSFDYGSQLMLQPDGKLVMSGYTLGLFTNFDFALARFNSNGSLDTGFSGDGKVTTNFNSQADDGWAVTRQSDGKIIVAGRADNASGMPDFGVARYQG